MSANPVVTLSEVSVTAPPPRLPVIGQEERIPGDLGEVIRIAMKAFGDGLWTALPGIIESYDPDRMTCVVRPAVNAEARLPNGAWYRFERTLLVDVPVIFPSGGGCTLTFPVKPGDECLVVFASRCIDGWWQLGKTQNAPVHRTHDLSDGFAIIGPRSQARLIPNLSATTVQLRTDDGKTLVEIDPEGQICTLRSSSPINFS